MYIKGIFPEEDATYLPPSETSDLESVTVGITLHWSETPFVTSGLPRHRGERLSLAYPIKVKFEKKIHFKFFLFFKNFKFFYFLKILNFFIF